MKLCATFLLPSKSSAPLNYAARANSRGAKFEFAFSLFDLCAITRQSPLPYIVRRFYFDPSINTRLNPCEVLFYTQKSRCIYSHVFMVESLGTAPKSDPISSCFSNCSLI